MASIIFKVALTAMLVRNVLLATYDLAIDTTSYFPILNPTMLHRLRANLAKHPKAIREVVVGIHGIFSASILIIIGGSRLASSSLVHH